MKLVFFIFLIFPIVVYAQDDMTVLSLEELLDIKVSTASLFVESSYESPATVAVFDHKDGRKMGVRRPTDYFFLTEGVQVYDGMFDGNMVIVRGFASSSNQSVSVQIDGVPLNRYDNGGYFTGLQHFATPFLESIEMIKGPSSTIYGGNAYMGVISYKTFGIDNEKWITEVNGATNRYGDFRILSKGLKFGNLKLFAGYGNSFQGNQKAKYNYIDDDTSTVEVAERRKSYRSHQYKIEAEYKVSQQSTFNLSYLGHNLVQEEGMSTGTLLNNNRVSVLKDSDTSSIPDMNYRYYRAELKSKLTENISSNIKAYHINNFLEMQLNTYNQKISSVIDTTLTNHEKTYGTIANLKVQLPESGLRFVIGADYKNIEVVGANSLTKRNGAIIDNSKRSVHGDRRAVWGTFIQGKKRILYDELALHAGVRFDNYSSVGSHASPRLSLVWAENSKTPQSLKLMYGNAFRPPTGNELGGVVGTPAPTDLSPEQVDSIELFYGKRFEHLEFSNSLHFNYRKDMILTTDSGAKNSGSSRSYGLESKVSYSNGALAYMLSGSYIRSKNIGDNYFYHGFPILTLTSSIEHKLESFGINSFIMGRYSREWNNGFDSTRRTPLSPYFQVDGSLEKRMNELSVWFKVRNIFDRKNFRPVSTGPDFGMPQERRSFSVGIDSSF